MASAITPLEPATAEPAAAPIDDRFDTSHLTRDLKRRTIRGGAVTLSSQGVKFALRLGSTAVLARLLTPADFGLVAMVTVVTGFVEMFKDAGLSMATVQREKITHEQVSTLFWINVGLSVVIMGIVAALSPAIAWFYGDPRLTLITLALAGTMVFGGLAVQHQALLKRNMQFGRLAAIEIASLVAGIVTAVFMAWNGFGYWSLVGMTAGSAATTAVMSFVMSGWLPGLPKKRSGVRPMLTFGANASGASVLNYFGANLDNLLIGWWSGAAALGLYTKAYGLLTLPIRQINSPIGAVAVPALSRAVVDPTRYRRAYVQMISPLALGTGMLSVLFIGCADIIISIVLGPDWLGAATIFRILGFAGFLLPIWNSTGWLFVSQARMGEHLRFHMLDSTAKVLSIVLGLPWGPLGVAVGVGVRYYVMVPVLFYIVGRRGPVTTSDLYGALTLPMAVNLISLALVVGLRTLAPSASPLVALIASAAVIGVVALVVCSLHPHGRTILRQATQPLSNRFRIANV